MLKMLRRRMRKTNNSIVKISFPLWKQLLIFFATIIFFAIMFKDAVLTILASSLCYYFVAFFFLTSFKISNSRFIIIYPYRPIFRVKNFKIDEIQFIKLYRQTGGKFNFPTIKLSFIKDGKTSRRTFSFLMPSSKDFTILIQTLKENVKNFEYFKNP